MLASFVAAPPAGAPGAGGMGTPGHQHSAVRAQPIARTRPSLKTGAIDFQEKWATLRQDLWRVLSNPTAADPADRPRLPIERHYDMVYKLCTFQCMHLPFVPQVSNTVQEGKPAPQLLYACLRLFLIEHVDAYVVRRVAGHGPEVLASYLREWTGFRVGMDYIHAVFHYMNRDWVTKQANQKAPAPAPPIGDVYEVRTLGYNCWRDYLYQRVRQQLTNALLEQVELDRKGFMVDHSLLKGVIQSIVSLGDQRKPQAFYTEQFERQFLKATEAFYTTEVAEKLSGTDDGRLLPDYMQHIERRLDEETRRLQLYLDRSTEKGLMRALVKVTIDVHINTLLDAAKAWFDEDRSEEQRRLFRLLARSDGGLEPLRKLIEDRIDTDGKATIEKVRVEAQKDPCVYVETILQVYEKYNTMVSDIFQDHEHFKAALEKGCRRFVNRNIMTPQSGAKSAELLAKYTHLLLKPTSKAAKIRSEEELDATLNQVLTIFKLLEDKDVFQKFYSTMLSRRLIQNSYLQEQEAMMIGKLKDVCGYEYTYKLQRMFTDMGLSRDLTHDYEEWLKRTRDCVNEKPELHSFVLTSGSWPLTALKSTTFEPPAPLFNAMERFAHFYRIQHNGRKLTWLYQHSNGFVKTGYPLPKGRNYELQVTTFQCAVLLAYNGGSLEDYPQHSFQELVEMTKLDEKDLDFALQVLCRHKLFTPVDGDESDAPSGAVASLRGKTIQLGKDFQSMNRKVQIHTAQPKEIAQSEDTSTMKVVSEDRRYAIQAAIVRIMKSRKQIQHQLLIVEVIAQLKGKFQPTQHDIKKNIDNLIEKEYMERGQDGKSYSYLA